METKQDPAYPVPVKMDEFRIYTTKGCNIACGFCSYAFRKNEQYMDSKGLVWNDPKAVANLEQMRQDFGVDAYMFSGVEPSLDYVWHKLAMETGVKHIRFNTNGVKWLNQEELAKFVRHVDDLEEYYKKDFWSYVSFSEKAHLRIFEAVHAYDPDDFYKKLVPYIVVNRDNYNDCMASVAQMFLMGTREFYWRFEYSVPEGPHYDASREKLIIPRSEHCRILKEVAYLIHDYKSPSVLNTAAETHPNVSPLKDLPDYYFTTKIAPRFEHSRCTAYEMSLTINFNGDITGCPKHSYHQDQTPYIVGNVLHYNFELLKERIAVAPKTYCLPVTKD